MSNKCCSCGIEIPEGRQVCSNCFKVYNDPVEIFVRELRKNQAHKKPRKRRKQLKGRY